MLQNVGKQCLQSDHTGSISYIFVFISFHFYQLGCSGKVAIESGDSSMVTLLTVDQEVWVRIPPMAEIKISVVRSLSGLLSPFDKMSNHFRWPQDLKDGSMSFVIGCGS